jgi:hypothetical protein
MFSFVFYVVIFTLFSVFSEVNKKLLFNVLFQIDYPCEYGNFLSCLAFALFGSSLGSFSCYGVFIEVCKIILFKLCYFSFIVLTSMWAFYYVSIFFLFLLLRSLLNIYMVFFKC